MELEGKKINFLGDSITQGVGASDVNKTHFIALMRESLHLAAARNYGISGTRIARQLHPEGDPYAGKDFCARYAGMDDDADIVVVFGGTNDFGHGDAHLGRFTDRGDDTFYGACHTLFAGLCRKYPRATIVVVTPTHRLDEFAQQKTTEPLVDYVRAEREVAEYYSLPVLDLYAVSGIQPEIPELRELYMPDGLHPSDAGHARIAERLTAFLRAL